MKTAIIEGIHPLGYKLDRHLFRKAAKEALDANPALKMWPGKKKALEEMIFKSEDIKRWYAKKHDDIIAGEMIAQRILSSPQVRKAIEQEELDADDVDYLIGCKLQEGDAT